MNLNFISSFEQASAKNGNNIILGCTVGVLSSACQSVGLILQRKSHLIAEYSKNNNIKISNYNRSLWHIGFFLFIFANIFGSSIQITSLPLIVLSPLQSIGLVFNTLFHSLLLNESFTSLSLLGTILISIGAFFIAYFGGSISEPEYNLKKFIELLNEKVFLNWILIDSILVLMMFSWILITNYQVRKNIITSNDNNNLNNSFNDNCLTELIDTINEKILSLNSAISQNLLLALKLNWFILVLSLLKISSNFYNLLFNHSLFFTRKIQGILYGCSSGILSAHSLLLAKSTIEILILAFINKNWNTLNNILAYLIVIVFLVLCLMQLFLLNRGLKYISTSILYPLVFCIYNITNISNGLIFFKQWNYLNFLTSFSICSGTLLVIVGVFILSSQVVDESNANNYNLGNSNNLLAKNTERKNYNSINNIEEIINNDAEASFNESDEPGLTSMNDLTNPQDPQSPYFDSTFSHFQNQPQILLQNQFHSQSSLSLTSPNISNNNSNNNNNNNNNNNINGDILTPILKRTTENLNNAGRKVSSFLKKSMDNFNNTTINSSEILSESPLRVKNKNLDNVYEVFDDSPEYVSFGSLKDSSSLNNNFESINQFNPNPLDSPVTQGLNLLQPIIGKLKGKSSHIDIDIQKQQQPINNSNILPQESSYKSGISFKSLKNFALNDNSHLPHFHTSPRLKNSKHHNLTINTSNEDYNPNNTFNYSLSNTIEEIQNQLSFYDENNNNNNNNNGNNQNLLPESSNHFETSNTSNNSSPIISHSHYQSLKNDKLFVNKNLKKNRNFTTGILRNDKFMNHKRVLSFEQNELINELKK